MNIFVIFAGCSASTILNPIKTRLNQIFYRIIYHSEYEKDIRFPIDFGCCRVTEC